MLITLKNCNLRLHLCIFIWTIIMLLKMSLQQNFTSTKNPMFYDSACTCLLNKEKVLIASHSIQNTQCSKVAPQSPPPPPQSIPFRPSLHQSLQFHLPCWLGSPLKTDKHLNAFRFWRAYKSEAKNSKIIRFNLRVLCFV